MTALELDRITWPEVKAEQQAGRDTLVVAFGATEQHGPHMPLATDALIGDHLARLVADRLDAFVAPTIRIGCSEHHLAFAGTLSISEQTFAGIVGDLILAAAAAGLPASSAAHPRRELRSARERLGRARCGGGDRGTGHDRHHRPERGYR